MMTRCDLVAQLALRALLTELSLTPKPGLVDRYNNGSHHDMNFDTFLNSAMALFPFFVRYTVAGFSHHGSLNTLFSTLRSIGQEAETAMLHATKGANTHKGANFSFAVLLGATGYWLQQHPDKPFDSTSTDAICTYVQQLCAKVVHTDLHGLTSEQATTHGERLFVTYGVTGIRGQAAAGYPEVTQLVLPFWRNNRPIDCCYHGLQALLLLMNSLTDSNLIHRGGWDAWQTVKQESQQLLQLAQDRQIFLKALSQYDETLQQRHLSPGGSADLLALSYFLAFLEQLDQPKKDD